MRSTKALLTVTTCALALGTPAPVTVLAGPPEGVGDAERTAAERATNEAGYREHVGGIRAFLLHRHLGEWVAIAGGKAHPTNEHRTMVRPARTWEEADAAARAAVPDARHRFVFRIGEEGDFEQPLGGAETPFVLGNWFLAELDRPDVEMPALGPGQRVHARKDGARVELTVKGPDHRMWVRPEVGSPGAAGRADALFVLSTGFGGYATLSAKAAAEASLSLWEVPGRIAIEGVFQKGSCRRARARMRFPGTDVDLLVPVAVWPEAR